MVRSSTPPGLRSSNEQWPSVVFFLFDLFVNLTWWRCDHVLKSAHIPAYTCTPEINSHGSESLLHVTLEYVRREHRGWNHAALSSGSSCGSFEGLWCCDISFQVKVLLSDERPERLVCVEAMCLPQFSIRIVVLLRKTIAGTDRVRLSLESVKLCSVWGC